jgi:DnaJ-class molecular chaperone
LGDDGNLKKVGNTYVPKPSTVNSGKTMVRETESNIYPASRREDTMESEECESGNEPIDARDNQADEVECPACRGTGRIVQLVSETRCEACGGAGKIERQAAEPLIINVCQGTWMTTNTYDAANTLVRRVETFAPDPEPGLGGE